MQSANSDELAFTDIRDLCNALKAYRINITVEKFGAVRFSFYLKRFLFLPRLHLFDQKYNKTVIL